jgi:hypothetical protein
LFFTWNRSEQELRLLLDALVDQHGSLRLSTSMGRCVDYLNVHISNRDGHLYTRVHHPHGPSAYILPYVTGHAQAYHRRWLLAALARAVRCCSDFRDFTRERIHIEMTCLLHGYSPESLERRLRSFYRRFNADAIRFSLDATVYDKLRRRLFDIIDGQRTRSLQQQSRADDARILPLYYWHDYGARQPFHVRFHQIWSTYLRDDPHLSNDKTTISLHAAHVYSLNALLASPKPPSHALDPSTTTTTTTN